MGLRICHESLTWESFNIAIFCGSEISRKLLFSRFNNQVTVTMVTRVVRRQLGAHGFDSFHSSLALLPDSQIFIFSVLLRTLSNGFRYFRCRWSFVHAFVLSSS